MSSINLVLKLNMAGSVSVELARPDFLILVSERQVTPQDVANFDLSIRQIWCRADEPRAFLAG